MLNRDVLARDPVSFNLADGGVAKVAFPPDPENLPVLREQLEMFVCEGAYAEALHRILDAYVAVAGGKADTPAAWISGFYGSGKSLLAAMLGALWTNHAFPDGTTAEGLIQGIPPDVRAALKELRTRGQRLGTQFVVGGTTLGSGAGDPVKAVLGVLMRAAGLPVTTDLRPMLCALWLDEQGVLDTVRAALGDAFPNALESFLLDDRIALAATAAKPSLGSADTLMDRLNSQYAVEPEATPDLLVAKGRQALTLGGKPMPLTLIVLDEVQQFIREDPNRSLAIQTIAENLASKFGGRVLLVCTGQSALGDTPYLERLLGRFPLRLPLGSADIQSVIRKTLLRKQSARVPDVQAMLEAHSGEIDKHLLGSKFSRTPTDRADAVADWPLLSTRRRLWERVMLDLDRSGVGGTLRNQLAVTLDALRRYGGRSLASAVPGDFLLESFGAQAQSRALIGAEIFDKVATERAKPGDGPLRARILLLAYMLARIAGDAADHGVRATPETFADLLIEDLSDAAAVRAKVPGLLASLAADGMVMDVGGEWRLQSKESAEWQAAFNTAQAEVGTDLNAIARHRAELLKPALEAALVQAQRVTHGASRTPRSIERVVGAATAAGGGVVLRLWNEWEHGRAPLDDARAADPKQDATLHLFVPAHRSQDLTDAIVAKRAAEFALQRMSLPTTEGGREAKKAMETKLSQAARLAEEILSEAVAQAPVLLAGGAEVGAGAKRAEAVTDAAGRVLDRLYPQFATGDHAAWGAAVTKAKARAPDAMKEVGHHGDGHTHPVCKALLQALGSGRKGAELRTLFGSPPYGWPKEAVDAGLRVLALTNQVRVTGPDHKQVADLAGVNDQALGTYTFVPESRTVTTGEKLAVRGLGNELGFKIASGAELMHLTAMVEKLAALALTAGGPAPAPAPSEVPGIATLRTATGNDLLAELASRADALKAAIVQWRTAASTLAARLPQWAQAETLIALGAHAQKAEAEAIRAQRVLLADPDPVAPLVAAAAAALVADVNAAHAAWRTAWEKGEARLKASDAWGRITPEKRLELRAAHALRDPPPPDLSTPAQVATSLQQRGCAAWRDMAAAHAGRVEEALRDAAVELEPRTQMVAVPRHTLRTSEDLDSWLDGLRAKISPMLFNGPVLPTA